VIGARQSWRAGPQRHRIKHLVAALATGVALLAIAGGCVVEDPLIEATTGATTGVPGPTASAIAPQFQTPTVAPPPTPAIPAASPTPLPTPLPTAAPQPLATPLPELEPNLENQPSLVQAGPVTVPVAGLTQFRLSTPRPVLQLPGHTLIYLDPQRQAEVDIFSPVAAGDGTPLPSYDDVIGRLLTDPIFADVAELDPVSIAGFASRVFEGLPVTGQRGFYNDLTTISNENAGWFPPLRVRMWVIDAPRGAVIVSAETLEDPGQYSDAVRLATEILTTITFST
jgi:hypothetical protein